MKRRSLKRRKVLRSVLKIYFSLVVFLLLTGCVTFRRVYEKRTIPPEPEMKPVEVVPVKEVQVEHDGFKRCFSRDYNFSVIIDARE